MGAYQAQVLGFESRPVHYNKLQKVLNETRSSLRISRVLISCVKTGIITAFIRDYTITVFVNKCYFLLP